MCINEILTANILTGVFRSILEGGSAVEWLQSGLSWAILYHFWVIFYATLRPWLPVSWGCWNAPTLILWPGGCGKDAVGMPEALTPMPGDLDMLRAATPRAIIAASFVPVHRKGLVLWDLACGPAPGWF